jgi:hypothetical protein
MTIIKIMNVKSIKQKDIINRLGKVKDILVPTFQGKIEENTKLESNIISRQ